MWCHLQRKTDSESATFPDEDQKNFTFCGLTLTVCLACFITYTGHLLVELCSPRNPAVEKPLEAYADLQAIAEAQDAYLQHNAATGNNTPTYAMFFVHLRTKVTRDGKKVPLNLIPKRIMLGMIPGNSSHGYHFVDVHERTTTTPPNKALPLDYREQWAVAALPSVHKNEAKIIMLVDQTGIVYAKTFARPPQSYPKVPQKAGWRRIERRKDLHALSTE